MQRCAVFFCLLASLAMMTAADHASLLQRDHPTHLLNASVLLGTWTNELNSTFVIENVYADGTLTGWYTSAVGPVKGPFYAIGQYDTTTNPDVAGLLAWTVMWNNAQTGDTASVTAWTGQLKQDGSLYASWILYNYATTDDVVWAATRVGSDQFSRRPNVA